MNVLGENLYEKLIHKGVSIPKDVKNPDFNLKYEDIEWIIAMFGGTSNDEITEKGIEEKNVLGMNIKTIEYTQKTEKGINTIICEQYPNLQPTIKEFEFKGKDEKSYFKISRGQNIGERNITAVFKDEFGGYYKCYTEYKSKTQPHPNNIVATVIVEYYNELTSTIPSQRIEAGKFVGPNITKMFYTLAKNAQNGELIEYLESINKNKGQSR